MFYSYVKHSQESVIWTQFTNSFLLHVCNSIRKCVCST